MEDGIINNKHIIINLNQHNWFYKMRRRQRDKDIFSSPGSSAHNIIFQRLYQSQALVDNLSLGFCNFDLFLLVFLHAD
jgi:hypothetical protein